MGYWKYGKKKEFAGAAGIAESYLCDILKRRRKVPTELAPKLQAATIQVEGLPLVPVLSWLYPDEYGNPLLDAK